MGVELTQYFLPQEVTVLQRAATYGQLAEVALLQLRRMTQSGESLPGIVCGPISTGGLGSKELNIAHFEAVVKHFVARKGGNFFSQIPFEESLWRVQALRAEQESGVEHPLGAGNPLLEGFYRPIFESGHIGAMYFIKGWQSSSGATWEHDMAMELGIKRCFLESDLSVYKVAVPAS